MQAAIQSQDGGAPRQRLEEIFQRHHRSVFKAAYRITGNPMDAEDVMQTVFMRLMRTDRVQTLSDDPTSYLHRAAVNAALDVQRSRKTRRATAIDDVEPGLLASEESGPERRVGSREVRERVREALGRLSPKMAEVFTLRYFEGFGNNEIAKMIGSTRSTVGVMLHRARHTLRNEIRDLQESRHEQE